MVKKTARKMQLLRSFLRHLKPEQLYVNKLVLKEQMKMDLFQYIEIWYNRERRHSAIGNLTIEKFWRQKLNRKNVAYYIVPVLFAS